MDPGRDWLAAFFIVGPLGVAHSAIPQGIAFDALNTSSYTPCQQHLILNTGV
jgi:hypothetical protein